jgi:integrative and conjugative element protein (TIGR02256 family)
MTFTDKNNHLTVLLSGVIDRILLYRQFSPRSKEAGGVLIGERRGPHLVIKRISEPSVGDKRTRHSVDRCGPGHQTAVDEAFAQSDGTLQYLGEWHTHPEDLPSPSPTDEYSWMKNIICSEPMIVIIVGRKRIWAGKKIGRTISHLIEI